MKDDYQWYAMRATYRREFVAREYLASKRIEAYVPTKKIVKTIGGIKRKVNVPAINGLIFVFAQWERLKEAKFGVEYLQYITKKEGEKNVPIIVPNNQMEQFIQVMQDDKVDKTFFSPQELDIEAGARVRIHGGAFDGLEGILTRIKGKRKKLFFIDLDGIVAVNAIIGNVEFLETIG